MKPEARLLVAKRCSWGTLFLVARGPRRVEHVLPAPGMEPPEATELVKRQGFSRELRAAHPPEVARALGLPHVEPQELLGECTGCFEELAKSLCREIEGILRDRAPPLGDGNPCVEKRAGPRGGHWGLTQGGQLG